MFKKRLVPGLSKPWRTLKIQTAVKEKSRARDFGCRDPAFFFVVGSVVVVLPLLATGHGPRGIIGARWG